jgi:hypothetical protein
MITSPGETPPGADHGIFDLKAGEPRHFDHLTASRGEPDVLLDEHCHVRGNQTDDVEAESLKWFAQVGTHFGYGSATLQRRDRRPPIGDQRMKQQFIIGAKAAIDGGYEVADDKFLLEPFNGGQRVLRHRIHSDLPSNRPCSEFHLPQATQT